MKRRRVFVDATFLRALLDTGAHCHVTACATFDELLAGYARGTTLLFTHAGMISAVGDHRAADVARVATVMPVRRGIRRTAAKVMSRQPELDLDAAVAVLMMRRTGITEIATCDPRYTQVVDALGGLGAEEPKS